MDYAKGIAIILVVAGHYYPAQSPDLWQLLRAFIYRFHMPVFFFVSGFLFLKELNKKPSFKDTVSKKFMRLGWPFLVLTVLLFIIKLIAGSVVSLEHPVSFQAVLNAFILPLNSLSPQLWFLQTIFIIFISYSFLRTILQFNHWVILLISLPVSFISITEYFSIDSVLRNLNYFCLGLIFAKLSLHEIVNRKLWLPLGSVLLAAAFFAFLNERENLLLTRLASYCGLFGVIGIALFLGAQNWRSMSWLRAAGFYSMGIYLFHTFFESPVRIAFYQIFKLPEAYFAVGFCVAVTAGVVCSLLLEKLVLRRFALTRKFILGLG